MSTTEDTTATRAKMLEMEAAHERGAARLELAAYIIDAFERDATPSDYAREIAEFRALEDAKSSLLRDALQALCHYREQTRPIAECDAVIDRLRAALGISASNVEKDMTFDDTSVADGLKTELDAVLAELDDSTNQTWRGKRARWAALVRAQEAEIKGLRKDAELLAWLIANPETAAECLEDAAAGHGTARGNLECRIAELTQANASERLVGLRRNPQEQR